MESVPFCVWSKVSEFWGL